jgi:phenylpropionate dioxygenase-like ring-hydroxylating dioxygenase large terminal subunit
VPANWKSVRDVDNEGYHVPVAHPALFDLYGRHYAPVIIAHIRRGVSRHTTACGYQESRQRQDIQNEDVKPQPYALKSYQQSAASFFLLSADGRWLTAINQNRLRKRISTLKLSLRELKPFAEPCSY